MIRFENVGKRYGQVTALDDMSFELGDKGVVGLLGPNGAGKTTTMRLITGFLLPTAGEVTVLDCNMRRDSLKARRQIGYLPEQPPLYPEMTGRTYLGFVARLRGLGRREAREKAEEIAALCQVSDRLDRPLGKLSRGQRQRFGIAQALVHDPDVLVLDEPTAGIDPAQVVETRQLLARLGEARLVVLSTHILSEVSTLCESFLLINNGRLVAHETMQGLARRNDRKQIRLRLDGAPRGAAKQLAAVDGVVDVHAEGQVYLLDIAPDATPNAAIVNLIAESQWTLVGFEMLSDSLEDFYLQLSTDAAAQ